MYGLLGFGSIEDELNYIAVLSVILVILLICEHRQKKLGIRQMDLNDLIIDTEMIIKDIHKRWRKKQQQNEHGHI